MYFSALFYGLRYTVRELLGGRGSTLQELVLFYGIGYNNKSRAIARMQMYAHKGRCECDTIRPNEVTT